MTAPIDTPIVAASGGRVIASGPASGYGLWVRIEHADGVITTYGHNNRNLVAVGQKVHTGQSIAEVGDGGESTGPHLHFLVEPADNPSTRSLLPGAERAAAMCPVDGHREIRVGIR
ncbi:peptidoglycan DD-metalloendopeptidase family protein [Amycolatopsis sp. RM579]|uniref:Peptidoglycan DD-metalloendopeptidase family protein n=1 Tax=Amycolatopsis pithecellobii TaxID=664692 RepID=A0A6N7Z8N3_9PSEU|nr:peptidoglycan DD-metalloendopeptidase family protein [Amycolatopsis pithecellobii]